MVLKLGPKKVQSVFFLEHLQEFNLDLCIPRYSNVPQVSCLGMNSGGGWNPNLEGSYLPEYGDSEADILTTCTEGFYRQPMKFSTPDHFPISIYRECTIT